MLKPAQLYEGELQAKWMNLWYNPEYMYCVSTPGYNRLEIGDGNVGDHDLVSVDDEGNILGFISYSIVWATKLVGDIQIVSFDKGNLMFIEDLYQAIYNCFKVYNFNKIEWSCYADNPAIRGYRKFIKRCGGVECGHFRKCSILQDGKLHDKIYFEILAEEFKPLERMGRKYESLH